MLHEWFETFHAVVVVVETELELKICRPFVFLTFLHFFKGLFFRDIDVLYLFFLLTDPAFENLNLLLGKK